jgi:hypothetical protein
MSEQNCSLNDVTGQERSISLSSLRSRPGAAEGGPSDIPTVRSEPTKQHKNYDDDEDNAYNADTAMTETVTVAAEAATEAAEQENHEHDDKNQSQGDGIVSFVGSTEH